MLVIVVSSFIYIFMCPVINANVVIVGRSHENTVVENMRQEAMDPDTIEVTCRPVQMCIAIKKTWLESRWGVDDFSLLGLGAQCDKSVDQNLTHVTLCTEQHVLLSCGTTYELNDTHVIYSNNVTVQSAGNTQADMTLQYNHWFRWRCIFPIRILVGVHVSPIISPITQFFGRQTGTGEFQAIMLLYKDQEYRDAYETPPRMTSDDLIRVQVKLMQSQQNVTKLQLIDCWATPGQDTVAVEPKYQLIENYCPVTSNAMVSLNGNGGATHVNWKSKVFRFIDFPQVYLHCTIRVCFDGPRCRKVCDGEPGATARRKRDVFDDVVVSLGPIEPSDDVLIVPTSNVIEKHFYDVTTTQTKLINNNDTIFGLPRKGAYAAFIILSILCLILLASAATCIWKRKKKRKREENMEDFAENHSAGTNASLVATTSHHQIPTTLK